MTPFEKARAVYQSEPCARPFEQDLMLHYLHGFVFSTPEFFVMGRAVDSKADHALILNPAYTFRREVCDAWHIWLAAGNLGEAWKVLPWPLKWLSFERKNEIRMVSADRLRDLSRIDNIFTGNP